MKELQLLIQAIEKAQLNGGVYSLQEVAQILNAISVVSKIVQEDSVATEPDKPKK